MQDTAINQEDRKRVHFNAACVCVGVVVCENAILHVRVSESKVIITKVVPTPPNVYAKQALEAFTASVQKWEYQTDQRRSSA